MSDDMGWNTWEGHLDEKPLPPELSKISRNIFKYFQGDQEKILDFFCTQIMTTLEEENVDTFGGVNDRWQVLFMKRIAGKDEKFLFRK